MDKINYRKEDKVFYSASAKQPAMIEVPSWHYLMIDGEGDPNTSPDYQAAVEALYSVSYALKFSVKKGELGVDYGVLPLEGLWWADDWAAFTADHKDQWKWTMMIRQPPMITADRVARLREQVREKKNPPALSKLRFEAFEEGKAAQIMHIGPFSEEAPTIEKLHAFIDAQGSQRRGKHHEIYLSDVRRAAPENWKTILRQPMT